MYSHQVLCTLALTLITVLVDRVSNSYPIAADMLIKPCLPSTLHLGKKLCFISSICGQRGNMEERVVIGICFPRLSPASDDPEGAAGSRIFVTAVRCRRMPLIITGLYLNESTPDPYKAFYFSSFSFNHTIRNTSNGSGYLLLALQD